MAPSNEEAQSQPRPTSFLDFAAQASRLWTPAKHLVFLADYLEALRRREIHKLLIQLPPRHAKSTTVDELFLPYWLLESPDDRAVLASYEATFARTWGRKARAVVKDVGPTMYGYGVKTDTDAAYDWEIEGHRGGMFTTGIGGPLTGRGFNIGVIDDPVKNEQEAASEVFQERNIDWYRSAFSTRKEPGAVEVLIMTRWHEADLAGRLLDEEYHEWTVVDLPAIAETGDMLGRQAGEALWPERYDREALETIRYGKPDPKTGERRGGLGQYFWSALYQQHPSPVEGAMFKREYWRRYQPEELKQMISVGKARGYGFLDSAQLDKPGSDYSALGTWFSDGSRYFVADMLRGRFQMPDLITAIIDWYAKWKIALVIEETPWFTPVIQLLERMRQQGRADVPPVIRFKIEGRSKITRAQAWQPSAEAHLVYLPYEAPWVGDWIEEHAAFPNGAHDDQVDTSSMAYLKLELDARTLEEAPDQWARLNKLRQQARLGR